jgi:hypothetical protein
MVSFAQTLYHLILGSQDSTTGQYQRGYTILGIDMAVFPKGTSAVVSGHGIYAGRNAVGITNGEVYEGDIIKDTLGIHYQIVGVKPWTWGDTFVAYECDLNEILAVDVRIPTSGASPVSDPKFFGFESITPGSVEFEDGFERGYFV